MSAASTRTRLLLILGIVAVGVATLVLKQQVALRELEQEAAVADRPEERARVALADADQAVLNKDDEGTWRALERTRDALDEAAIAYPGDLRIQRSRLVVARRLAATAQVLGRAAQARTLLEEALSQAQALFDKDRLAERARLDLLHVARELGRLLSAAGEHGRAAQVMNDAAAAVEAAQGTLPGEATLQSDLAEVWLETAEAWQAARSPAEAAKALKTGAERAMVATRGGEDPVAALAGAYTTVGRAARLADELKLPEALELAHRAIKLLEEQKAMEPEKSSLDRGLAQWHGRLADRAEATGNDAAALAAHQAAITARQAVLRREPTEAETRRDLVRALNSLGAYHSTQGRNDAALAKYLEAVEAAGPLGDDRTRLVAVGHYAPLLGRLDRIVEARVPAAEAYAVAVRLAAAPDAQPVAALDAASAGLRHARLLRADPKPDRAAALTVARTERKRLAELGEKAGPKGASVAEALEALVKELGG